MDLRFSDEDEAFRREVRDWLETNLAGDFAEARGLGGPGREENEGFDVRLAWERHLAADGWTCIGWPKQYGGRGASVTQQVVFHEESALAAAPPLLCLFGGGLIGPWNHDVGTDEQRRALPPENE